MAKKTEEAAEAAGPAKKSNKTLLIVAAVVVLVAGGGGAYFMMRPGAADAVAADAPEVTDKEPRGLVSMETFIVNVYHPDGDHHAKLKLDLAVVPAGIADAVAGDTVLQARLRDRVLTLLTSKSFDDLRSPVGKEGFRREVKAKLDPLLEGLGAPGAQIEEVLFSEFVVQ